MTFEYISLGKDKALNLAALAKGLEGVTRVSLGPVIPPEYLALEGSDGYNPIRAAMPDNWITCSIEGYANGALNVFCGPAKIDKVEGFVRVRP